MRTKQSTRRSFLQGSLAGTASAGAAALALPAAAAPGKSGAQKKVITRPGEPLTPASLFSPATQLGNLLFLSGSGAHDPKTHKVVPGPIGNQVKRCLENLKTVLEAAGSSMNKVLKCNVYLADLKDYAGMNEVFRGKFGDEPPVRTTVAVAGVPGNSLVEIDVIACL